MTSSSARHQSLQTATDNIHTTLTVTMQYNFKKSKVARSALVYHSWDSAHLVSWSSAGKCCRWLTRYLSQCAVTCVPYLLMLLLIIRPQKDRRLSRQQLRPRLRPENLQCQVWHSSIRTKKLTVSQFSTPHHSHRSKTKD